MSSSSVATVKHARRQAVVRAAAWFVVVPVLLLHMVPIATMLLNSIRSNSAVQRQILGWPAEFEFQNFIDAWVGGDYARAFLNTVVINTGTVVLVITVNVLAAYGLTRLPIFAKELFSAYFVIAIAVPAFAIVVPLYFGMNLLGLVNTHLGMILIYAAIFMPFSLLLTRAYFLGIPRELEEAALIDGCTELQALRRVTLPLAAPIISTTALIVFVSAYNEFLFANVMLRGENRTAALGFYNFVGRYSADLGTVFAAATITLLPILIIYLLLQRRFVDGFAAGGLKG